MKKQILFSLLFSAFALNLFAQIPNNDLENWYTQSFYGPSGFTHSYGNNGKSSDAHGGSTSAKIQGNYGGGFLIIGETGMGMNFKGGAPFAAKPDSLVFWNKSQLATSDTAFAYLSFKKNGTILNSQWFPISGNSSSYRRLAYKITWTGSQTPDSIILAFTSSNINGMGEPASWILIDDISFTGTTTNIQNPGFENWVNITYDVPTGWWTPYADRDRMVKEPELFEKTYDNATGEYAIIVKNTKFNGEMYWGQTETGSDNWWGWPAFPVTARHDTLYGLYKWLPQQKDSWSLYIWMFKAGNRVGTGEIIRGDSQGTYAIFKCPISYSTSDVPDSAVIQFSSYGPNGPKGESKLYLDNINFNKVYGVGTRQIAGAPQWIYYPNPARETLHVVLPVAETQRDFQILSLTGSVLKSFRCAGELNCVSLADLAPGMYILHQQNGAGSTRFVKQ